MSVDTALRSSYGPHMAHREDLPPNVADRLDAMAEGIAALLAGDGDVDLADLHERLLAAVRSRVVHHDPYDFVVDPTTIAQRRMVEMRKRSKFTQAQLAKAMEDLGFPWRRGTVTETELGRHRLDIDELFALAALFGVPVVELLLPKEGEAVDITGDPDKASVGMDSEEVRNLVLGRGGKAGAGGPTWGPAADMPPGINRPAKALWEARRAAGEK